MKRPCDQFTDQVTEAVCCRKQETQHLTWALLSNKVIIRASQVALVVKNLPASAGDMRHGLDPWVRRSPGGGHGNPLQYSCLKNPMDRGAWWAAICGVAQSQTRLKRLGSSSSSSRSDLAHTQGHNQPHTCTGTLKLLTSAL